MATIRDIDLGTVTSVTPRYVRRHSIKELAGVVGSYAQDMKSERITFDIQGFLDNPTQDERESFNALRDGNPSLVEMTEEGLYGWAKVLENDFRLREYEAGIWSYRLNLAMIPCIGTTRMLTADGGFSDLGYHRLTRALDPCAGRHNVTIVDSLVHYHELYVINLKASEQTLEFEVFAGDDLIRAVVWGWKTSVTWDIVNSWGTDAVKAWGETHVWVDEDSDSHTFRLNHDIRGANVADFTKDVSRALGNEQRLMVQITGLDAYSEASAKSTKYGDFQLLLKLALTHTSRETARPYPIVSYKDGGFGLGPA